MPVSRKLGQYLLQSMDAAPLEDMIASTMQQIFITGIFTRKIDYFLCFIDLLSTMNGLC